jgi:hypothetical protein
LGAHAPKSHPKQACKAIFHGGRYSRFPPPKSQIRPLPAVGMPASSGMSFALTAAMRFLLSLVGAGILGGCGGVPPAETQPAGALVLQIHLPAMLSRTETRRQSFVSRVSRLDLTWTTQSGKSGTRSYPTGQWDQMVLPETGFPQSDGDRLHLSARVWDSTREGVPRLIPALSGRAVLKKGEMAKQGPTNIHLKLSLRVPVAEYD